ncbi:MAG: hypothetical protein EPN17_12500 [Methylobacter sp.]|nr:MAG: hypothetical protein EPN17_12500 [Methylobacter sp.]
MKKTLLMTAILSALSASGASYAANPAPEDREYTMEEIVTLANTTPDLKKPTDNNSKRIKDSYIVIFKDPIDNETPLILPAGKTKNTAKYGDSTDAAGATGQSKKEVEETLQTNGKVISIFESINAVHMEITSAEALRLSKDSRVKSIEQDRTLSMQGAYSIPNPGWGADRLDEDTAMLDNDYTFDANSTGKNEDIYIVDTGLNWANSNVVGQFVTGQFGFPNTGSRLQYAYDVNYPNQAPFAPGVALTTTNTASVPNFARDCVGHGTSVASAAAGISVGMAKTANVKIVKVASGCTTDPVLSLTNLASAINWVATHAPKGAILNLSSGMQAPKDVNDNYICASAINTPYTTTSPGVDAAVQAAYNNGVAVIVAAGNDNCNAAFYSPAKVTDAFVVGATTYSLLNGKDAKASFSRYGTTIDAFAPGESVVVMHSDGSFVYQSGTSFSAPYVAGILANACGDYDSIVGPVLPACKRLVSNAAGTFTYVMNPRITSGTVTNTDGTVMTNSPSKFVNNSYSPFF